MYKLVDAMPYSRLFTQVDPVVELRKHNMAPTITREKSTKRLQSNTTGMVWTGVEKETSKLRERSSRSKNPEISSSTVRYPSSSKWNREGSTLGEYSRKVKFPSNFSQQKGKWGIYQSKAKGKIGLPSKDQPETKTTWKTLQMLKDATTITAKRRQSGQSETPEKLRVNSSRKRSLSVPLNGRETYSISTIVKARSLAMKWRGNKGRQGRRHTMLPTITDDSTKFSLCANVKRSPQFEEVVKLLEGDQNIDDAVSGFKLLQLK